MRYQSRWSYGIARGAVNAGDALIVLHNEGGLGTNDPRSVIAIKRILVNVRTLGGNAELSFTRLTNRGTPNTTIGSANLISEGGVPGSSPSAALLDLGWTVQPTFLSDSSRRFAVGSNSEFASLELEWTDDNPFLVYFNQSVGLRNVGAGPTSNTNVNFEWYEFLNDGSS